MLRAALARAIVSGGQSSTSAFHTSSIVRAGLNKTKQKARAIRRSNTELKAERQRLDAERRPHVVLGTRPGEEETLWAHCDLAKIIITSKDVEAVSTSTPPRHSRVTQAAPEDGFGEEYKFDLPNVDTVKLPPHLNYGVSGAQQEELVRILPALTAQSRAEQYQTQQSLYTSHYVAALPAALNQEVHKANMLGKVMDLRNANAGGIAYENRRRIIAAFSEPEKPQDTGRPEVQAALLTLQIRNLWSHLTRYKKDIRNRRSLRELVHKRAKILKYLKRKHRDRYDIVLERLALHPEAVEGELVV
ncbi:hypothetical protein PUNSTDRAFT_129892 [Punctularia strigosozonata HHB-11173 SS5]|uniref:uncharacterized protein n=1 Tax=Punctularia strigosozonata (strain HHB-11173) TaxID=741275 RepID=UPI0004417DD0|nr:uncharacterized protein PUNSTDRAFT_129892 [Punctularia strigosozonata HHB-11173 SS5]EIN14263.1 hypothetical protein PUNSTDRAFT_129892 [Punctularia strigosozonata HHB-11173 SS5]